MFLKIFLTLYNLYLTSSGLIQWIAKQSVLHSQRSASKFSSILSLLMTTRKPICLVGYIIKAPAVNSSELLHADRPLICETEFNPNRLISESESSFYNFISKISIVKSIIHFYAITWDMVGEYQQKCNLLFALPLRSNPEFVQSTLRNVSS